MHCIWSLPEGAADFSTRWRIIKTTVTQHCNERLNNAAWLSRRRVTKGQSTLWQHRFWKHLIRDEKDFAAHVDYIHWPLPRPRHSCVHAQRNPVKHGHAQYVTQWPYSSFHRYVREGVLTPTWAGGDLDGEFGEAVG